MIETATIHRGLPTVIEQVESWRNEGFSVVFTNGCFDLLHRAHVLSLEDAKALGDKLIVGVNSDFSIKKLKGITRPIQHEEDRIALLSRLRMIDALILFDETEPLHLITAIEPHIYAKGGDYTIENLPHRDIIAQSVHQIIITPIYPYLSTTQLIHKIQAL